MSDDDCIHLLPPGQCSYCKPKPEGFAMLEGDFSGMVLIESVFPAKYAGHCNACNLPIHVGQSILWRPERPVIHERCK